MQISHSMHNTRKKKSCRRREHHHLSLLLLQKTGVAKDIAQLVFSFLDAHVLVRCSMVSKHLRKLVDVSHSNIFARDLLWWGSFEHASISTHYREAQQMSVCTWDEHLSQFSLFTCANSSSAQTLWMLNSCPGTNTIIRMRLQVILPTANRQVMLSGESNQVDKVLKRGRASVDVLAWRIIEVIEGQTNATVRLSAVEFQHNTVRVGLNLTAPIVLQVENVPLQTWPYRCLWVMRGVRKCMNCKQRPRAAQSMNAKHTAHRVLCSLCLDLLYARQAQLGRKWKVTTVLPKNIVPRVHYVSCYMGAPTSTYPAEPDIFVLKQDVAAFFKYATWTDFIANNYKHTRQLRRWVTRASTEDAFTFSSHWFSSATA